MIGTLKGAALFGATGAVVTGIAEVIGYALLQSTTPPAGDLVGGAATGGAVSMAVFWIYKARVDRLEETKADKHELVDVHDTLREIKEDIRYLVRGDRKDRGES